MRNVDDDEIIVRDYGKNEVYGVDVLCNESMSDKKVVEIQTRERGPSVRWWMMLRFMLMWTL